MSLLRSCRMHQLEQIRRKRISISKRSSNKKRVGIASTRRTRDGWGDPTEFTVICTSRFEPECFEVQPDPFKSFGLGCKKAKFRSGAVPTIF